MSDALSLIQLSDLLGRYRYVELELFSGLGRRAVECERVEFVVYLEGASRAHAFRAGLFEALLPNAPNLADRPWTRSPGAALDEALACLVASGDDDGLVRTVVGVLYPAMALAYAAHLEECAPVSDGPVRRVLTRALADLEAVRAEAPAVGTGGSGRASRVDALVASLSGPFGPLVGVRQGDDGPGRARAGGY